MSENFKAVVFELLKKIPSAGNFDPPYPNFKRQSDERIYVTCDPLRNRTIENNVNKKRMGNDSQTRIKDNQRKGTEQYRLAWCQEIIIKYY